MTNQVCIDALRSIRVYRFIDMDVKIWLAAFNMNTQPCGGNHRKDCDQMYFSNSSCRKIWEWKVHNECAQNILLGVGWILLNLYTTVELVTKCFAPFRSSCGIENSRNICLCRFGLTKLSIVSFKYDVMNFANKIVLNA